MAYDVSSSFNSLILGKQPTVVRRFTIAGSDYSKYVLKWPKFKRKWDDVRPRSLNLDLANDEQAFNFFKDDKTTLETSCAIEVGVENPFSDISGSVVVGTFEDTAWGAVPTGVAFNNDGTKMYTTDSTSSTVREYNLSVPWMIESAVYFQNFDFSATASNGRTVRFNDDGTEMYIAALSANDRVHQFTLSTAWDINSASHTATYDPTAQVATVSSLAFSDDGTKMYVGGWGEDTVFQYTLSPAWDLSSASYASLSYVVSTSNMEGFHISNDGTKLYAGVYALQKIVEVNLSTAWNISTGSEYSSLSTVGFDTSCTDVFASPDGKYLYAMGNQTDTLYQLTLNKETIELFSGKPRKVKYSKGKATLSIVDKFQQLSDRQIGDSTNIKVFSEELPSEIAWAAVTSYGGYSSIAGSNNPDIDYDAFAAWAGVFSGDNVLMSANFDGQKCTEVLRKISRSTGSAIFIKENRISFHRYTIVDTDITSLGNSEIINMNLEFDSNEIVNKQYVGAAWSTESDYHTITVYDEDTTSVNSFGLKESNFKDENLYYINSASALNFAQRITFTQAEPQDKLVVETAMNGMLRQIGETISVVDNQLSIAGGYRVMNYEIDMDKGKVTFGADRTQLVNAFILDVTSLDGTEILT